MKPLCIVQNVSHEGAGLLEEILQEENLPHKTIDLQAGDPFPQIQDISALIVMGGPQSANDETPHMQAELAGVRAALKSRLPYFGVCLGLQILVKAAGGSVVKNSAPEIGFRDPRGDLFQIDLTPEGERDPLFEGMTSPLPVFHLHGETVRLTPSMTLLGTGSFCHHQAVKAGPCAYGFQGHLELTLKMLEDWMRQDDWLKERDPHSLRADYERLQGKYRRTCSLIFRHFLSLAGFL